MYCSKWGIAAPIYHWSFIEKNQYLQRGVPFKNLYPSDVGYFCLGQNGTQWCGAKRTIIWLTLGRIWCARIPSGDFQKYIYFANLNKFWQISPQELIISYGAKRYPIIGYHFAPTKYARSQFCPTSGAKRTFSDIFSASFCRKYERDENYWSIVYQTSIRTRQGNIIFIVLLLSVTSQKPLEVTWSVMPHLPLPHEYLILQEMSVVI